MKYILFFVIGFSLACSNSEKKKEANTENNLKEAAFRKFVNKFKLLSLPIQLRNHTGISLDGLSKINKEEAKIFLNSEGNYYCYGMLSDTTDYYSFILLYPADIVVPQLFTFTKEGEMIDMQELIVNGCFMDCGWRKCTSDCLIDDERNITLIDTSDFYQCDDAGEELPDKREYFMQKITIKMSNDGKFGDWVPEKTNLLLK